MKRFLVLMLMFVTVLPCFAGDKVPVIFDTDMGPDYDDVGALAVLHRLSDLGEAEVLAAGSSNHLPNSVKLIGIINRSFGRGTIPIGAMKGKGATIDAWHKGEKWTQVLPERYPCLLYTSPSPRDS